MKNTKFPRGFLNRELICETSVQKDFLLKEIRRINQRFVPRIKIVDDIEKFLLKKNDYMYFLDKYQVISYFNYFTNKNEKRIKFFLQKIKNRQILFENNQLDHLIKRKDDIMLKELNKISDNIIDSYYKGIVEFAKKFENLKINSNKKLKKVINKNKSKDKGIYKLDNYNFKKEDFINYVEDKVFVTIDYILDSLNQRNKKLGVESRLRNITIATSGGKDSLTVLSLMKKYSELHNNCFNITALCIDEGIEGYRSHTIKDLEIFCNNLNLNYKVISFEEYYSISLDEAVKRSKLLPCNICGVFRRQTLNYGAIENNSDIIATGHNFDDEYQAYNMNIIKNNNDQFYKMGPITGYLSNESGFVQRIKPLYFLTEKEVLIYSILKQFQVKYNECPYAYASFRGRIRDVINKNGYNKEKSFNLMFSLFEEIKKNPIHNNRVGKCEICGQPSSNKICKACLLKKDLKI